jgi:hypothetical protein
MVGASCNYAVKSAVVVLPGALGNNRLIAPAEFSKAVLASASFPPSSRSRKPSPNKLYP